MQDRLEAGHKKNERYLSIEEELQDVYKRQEAEQKIEERYRNEDIILNENDYVDTDFHVIKETRIMNHDER